MNDSLEFQRIYNEYVLIFFHKISLDDAGSDLDADQRGPGLAISQNVLHGWLLTLLSITVFLRLSYSSKLALLSLITFVYLIVMALVFDQILAPRHSSSSSSSARPSVHILPLHIDGSNQLHAMLLDYLKHKNILILSVFYVIITYHSRLIELISRLDFLWKLQAQKELQDMRELRHYNTQLLRNILPDHVANYFLAHDNRLGGQLYAQSYSCVGVLFASIPNFASFYSEEVNNGMECIRLLNEIIFDFDQLLDEDRFRSIEKIKTISSTYMAVCGLNPKDQHKQASDHLCALTEFALAMRSRLQELNVHSFNNFQLRVGLSVGALVGGVIGAKKPVFDVWGDTVNEASRMESTGRLDAIQISKVGADILAAQRYPVQRRGVIHVKGKGNMETYFVYGKSLSPQTECNGTWLASNVTTTATGGMAADTSDKSTSNIGGSLLEKNLSNASTTAVGSGLGAMAGGVTMTGSSIVMGGGAGVPGTTAVTGGAGASSSCGGSSLAEVMFNMVQVRKKQTLAGSLSVPQATPSIGSNKAQPKHGRLNFTLRSGTSSGTGGIALDDELSTESGGVGDSSNLLMGLSGLDRAHLSSGPFRSGFRLQRIKSEKPANRKSGHKRKYLSKIRLSDGFADFNSSNFRGTLLDFAARHRNGNNNVPIDTPHAPIVSRATAAGSQSAVNIPPESFASSDLNELQQKLISTSGSIDGSNDAIVLGTKIASSDTGSGQSSPQTTTEQLIEMRNCRSVSPTVTTSNRSIRKRDKQVDYL